MKRMCRPARPKFSHPPPSPCTSKRGGASKICLVEIDVAGGRAPVTKDLTRCATRKKIKRLNAVQCQYVFTCTCTYIYMCIYIYTYVLCTYIFICTHTHIYIYIYMHKFSIDQPIDKTSPQETALCAGNRRAPCAMSNRHTDDRGILGHLPGGFRHGDMMGTSYIIYDMDYSGL